MQIKIIATPPGDAPEWVREEWIGLTLPVAENIPNKRTIVSGVLGGPALNIGGYPIRTADAIEILRKKSLEAAKWWDENVFQDLMPWLILKKEVCR